MATSSALSTSNTYIKYSITCVTNSQNVSSNTSNVTVSVRFWRTNTGYETYGTGTVSCKINGTTYTASVASSQKVTSSGIVLFTKTLDIGHNSDGTKSLAMSAWISHSQFSSSEQSYSESLKTIPRASSFTMNSSSLNAGATLTLTISRASSSFTHNTHIVFGTGTYTIQNGAATSASVAIPYSILNQIPNTTSGTGTVYVDTYNGSTKIGTTSRSITISAPSDVVPTFSSIGVARVDNGVPSAWGIYVQGKSKATLTINGAAGSYSSTIKSYSISGGGYSTTSSSFTTGTLNSSGTNTFTATITDSRGRTASKTVSLSVEAYSAPNITSSSVVRCNSSGVASDSGTYLKAIATYTYSSCSSKNTIAGKTAYKTLTGSYTGEVSLASNSTGITYGGGNISINSSYTARITVADAFQTVTKEFNISTAATTLDLKSGGKGIAIGKVAETDGFEVAWDSIFTKNLAVKGTITGGITMDSILKDSRLTTGNQQITNVGSNKIYVGNPSTPLVLEGNSFSLNGSFNISEKSYNGSWWNRVPIIGGDGVIELGKFIDFHSTSNDGGDYTARVETNTEAFMIKYNGGVAGWVGLYRKDGVRYGYIGNGSATNENFVVNADTGHLTLHASAAGGVISLYPYNKYVYCNGHFVPDIDNTYYLGTTSPAKRWKQLCAVTASIATSDVRYKKKIEPIEDENISTPYIMKAQMSPKTKTKATREDYYDFIKDRFKPYSYEYLTEDTKEDAETGFSIDDKEKMAKSIGFIADEYDLENDLVAKEFIFRTDDGLLNYNTGNYVTVGLIALQQSIHEIENLKSENNQLKDEILEIKKEIDLIKEKL